MTPTIAAQYYVFFGLSALIFLFTIIADRLDRLAFQKYFGKIPPVLGVLIAFILGLVLFTLIFLDGRFAFYRIGNYRGILLALGLAVPFAAVIILIDRKAPFPVDLNVPFPGSIFFYPAIGYVVEIIFHLLPFCLLYFLLGAWLGETSQARVIWVSILVVALIEPVFQVIFTAGRNTNWVVAYVGLHLFMFNLVQLLLFKRYDFISMYAFRLSYYLIWHILWGYFRLSLLF
jgi:hypothetical protein